MIRVERAGAIATIVIDDPEKRNRLSSEAMRSLAQRLRETDDDPEMRAIVITGAGDKAFCAGADLGQFKEMGIVEQRWHNESYRELCMALFNMKTPVVARVNGIVVAGGMGLVTLAHLAIAADHARFGTPEINVGAFPNMVMAGIFRGIPKKAAMKLVLLGDLIDAQEALSMGLVNAVVPYDRLDQAVMEVAEKLAAKSQAIMSLGLDAIRISNDLPYTQALEYLRDSATIIRSTEDCREGAAAFFEKREPQWKGK